MQTNFEMTKSALPDLPPVWLKGGWAGEAAIFDRVDGRRVLFGIEAHRDGLWRHASISRADRLPSWEELREVKDLFFGKDTMVVQILPPESEYVNRHPYCLHLWQYLDGDRWPMKSTK